MRILRVLAAVALLAASMSATSASVASDHQDAWQIRLSTGRHVCRHERSVTTDM